MLLSVAVERALQATKRAKYRCGVLETKHVIGYLGEILLSKLNPKFCMTDMVRAKWRSSKELVSLFL